MSYWDSSSVLHLCSDRCTDGTKVRGQRGKEVRGQTKRSYYYFPFWTFTICKKAFPIIPKKYCYRLFPSNGIAKLGFSLRLFYFVTLWQKYCAYNGLKIYMEEHILGKLASFIRPTSMLGKAIGSFQTWSYAFAFLFLRYQFKRKCSQCYASSNKIYLLPIQCSKLGHVDFSNVDA